MTPLEDQQLAGLMIWIPAGVIFCRRAPGVFPGVAAGVQPAHRPCGHDAPEDCLILSARSFRRAPAAVGRRGACAHAASHHVHAASRPRLPSAAAGRLVFILAFFLRGRVQIHDALCNISELLIRRLFFLERFFEQVDDIVEFEQTSMGD
jgi:hypothetical protein